MAANVKVLHPGKYGGTFYFTASGNIRYGKRPDKTVKVTKLFFPEANPYPPDDPKLSPFFPVFEAMRLVNNKLGLRSPKELRDFIKERFWKKRGLSDEAAEGEWQTFMRTFLDNAQIDVEVGGKASIPKDETAVPALHIVEPPSIDEEGDVVRHHVQAARRRERIKLTIPAMSPTRTTMQPGAKRQLQIGTTAQHSVARAPIWNTLDLSATRIVEADDYQPRGLKLTLADGTKLTLSPQAEEMAWDFATRRLPAKGTALKHCWARLVENFSDDFSKEVGRKVDLETCKWREFEYAAGQEAAKKQKLKEAGKLPKTKQVKGEGEFGTMHYSPKTAHMFALIDGEPEFIGKKGLVLPAAGMYKGTSGHTEHVGRWRRKVKLSDVLMNATSAPKGWSPKQLVADKSGEWLLAWNNPVTGSREYKRLNRESTFKQKRTVANKQKGIDDFHEHYEKVQSAIVDALNSSDPIMQEIGFAAMLMDTMHARIGNQAETHEAARMKREPTIGVVQFTPQHLKRDGSYKFLGKDHVEWDSNFEVHLPLSDKGVMTGMNPAAMTGPKYDARPIYDRLAARAGSNGFLFSIGPDDVNAWLRAATGSQDVHNHNFRHFHGTRYFLGELARFTKELDAKKKAGTLTAQHFKRIMDHCGEVAAVKLGHRRTVSAEKAAEVHAKRAADLAAAKKKAKAAGKKFDEKAYLASYKTVGLGSSTTRTSYIDFDKVLTATYPRWGLDFRSNTEKKNTRAYGFEARFGITAPTAKKTKKKVKGKKTKKGLVIELAKSDEIEVLLRWSPLDDDPVPRPVDGDNTYASHWYMANEEWRPPMEKSLRLVITLRKAIGTKQSEDLKPTKQAKKPSKSSGQYVDPKNGKKRYQYKGKTPDKGPDKKKTGSKATPQKKAAPAGQKQGQPAGQPQVQDGPPPLKLDELAAALQVPVGTLTRFALRFKTADDFVAHTQQNLRPFLTKHNLGGDVLRRVYEQLVQSHK